MSELGPAVAGSWYPASTHALRQEVDRLLEANPAPEPCAGVRAVIAPHAGYVYSGATAARVFAGLRDQPVDRVVLLGPSHYVGFAGAVLTRAGRYRTPLGGFELDLRAAEELAVKPGLEFDDGPFGPEHSLEAEIPFLQRVVPDGCKLLPILVGARSTAADVGRLSEALSALQTPDTLFVISSDFTHFGPRFGYVPFRDELPRRIEGLDMGAVERILSGDAAGFREYVDETGATICGRHAIDLLLRILPSGTETELAAYDTSGRMTGDWEHSVSYAGLVFREPASTGMSDPSR